MYSPAVLDHFQSPRHVGEMSDPDGVGEAGNPINGNTIMLYLQIEKETIIRSAFRAFGCPATIAAGSRVSEWVIGKTTEEALGIEDDTIERDLGGLPPTKRHCSALAADSVRLAIENYRTRRAP
jgi:nitrogen fixation NifU-like protein